MEREIIMKPQNGNPSSLHYRPFVHNNTPKDASFSSYIKPEPPKPGPGEDIIGGVMDDCDQISVFDAENYFSESNDQKERKEPNATMKSNGNLECSIANSRLSSVSSIDGYGRNYRINSFHATPTASSEASWNSQTGLLSNPQGSIGVSLKTFHPNSNQKRVGSSSGSVRNWFLKPKCPCFGKKSVQVEENLPKPTSIPSIFDPRIPPTRSVDPISVSQNPSIESLKIEKSEIVFPNFRRPSQENHFPPTISHQQHQVLRSFPENGNGIPFSFPILNVQSSARVQGVEGLSNPNSLEEPPRESLEVFQPPSDNDAINVSRARRNFPFPASPMSRITSTEDDVASDASSDLFEIESLSTHTNSHPIYPRRDSFDEATTFNLRRSATGANGNMFRRPSVDSVAATECYAPSEASVDWSVTTAEGFDRGSVANFSASVSQIDFNTKFSGGGGDGGKWNALGLSCRGEKAVCVGPRAVKEDGGWAAVVGGTHAPRVRHVRSGDSDNFCYRADSIYPIFQ